MGHGARRVRRVSPRVLEVTIGEGRNRQVRRMIEAVGNEVVELARIRFGSIDLGDCPRARPGGFAAPEVQRLWKDARAVEKPDE